MSEAEQWVHQHVWAYADRDFPIAQRQHVLSRGPVAISALGAMLARHPEQPGRAAEHAVVTLKESRDNRALAPLLLHVDVEEPDLAMVVDDAVLSFGTRAVAPLLEHTLRDPERYGELLAELVGHEGPAPVVAAFAALFETHLGVAVEGASLLKDRSLLPAAVQATLDFDPDAPNPDVALFQRLLNLIEHFGVSPGPVAYWKAQVLGLR